jgi:hypothetical protein
VPLEPGAAPVFTERAETEGDARAMFKTDPWMGSILQIAAIERWTLWIGADRL